MAHTQTYRLRLALAILGAVGISVTIPQRAGAQHYHHDSHPSPYQPQQPGYYDYSPHQQPYYYYDSEPEAVLRRPSMRNYNDGTRVRRSSSSGVTIRSKPASVPRSRSSAATQPIPSATAETQRQAQAQPQAQMQTNYTPTAQYSGPRVGPPPALSVRRNNGVVDSGSAAWEANPPATAAPAPVYRNGEEIRKAQGELAALGFEVGSPDGVLGPQTQAALVAFRRQHAITEPDVLGEKTRQVLTMLYSEKMAKSLNQTVVGKLRSIGQPGNTADGSSAGEGSTASAMPAPAATMASSPPAPPAVPPVAAAPAPAAAAASSRADLPASASPTASTAPAPSASKPPADSAPASANPFHASAR